MKKTISAIVASVIAVSALTAVSASAINLEEENVLSVSTETVASTMTIDGTEVPAGDVAITDNIDNNSGFNSSTTKIELGEAYNVITNSVDIATITIGTVMGDSHVCAIEKNNTIVIASASASDNVSDGAMFTFYAIENKNSSDKSINFIDINNNVPTSNARSITYRIGDVNQDNTINASDSSDVLSAIALNGGKKINVSTANANLSYYFPNALRAESADTDKSTYITQGDADDILLYYTCTQTGSNYADCSDYYCGEYVTY